MRSRFLPRILSEGAKLKPWVLPALMFDPVFRVLGRIGVYVFKVSSPTAGAVARVADKVADVRLYRKPEELPRRLSSTLNERRIDPNTEAQDVELHKDHRWYRSWKVMTETGGYISGCSSSALMNWKLRLEDSDSLPVRLVRGTARVLADLVGSNEEMLQVMTELATLDPTFEINRWLRYCQMEVIPIVLEAQLQGNFDVLKDWCCETALTVMVDLYRDCATIGYNKRGSEIIDVSNMELVKGEMTEKGPVLVVRFNVDMVEVLRNRDGKIIAGDPEKPIRVMHTWALRRDREERDPKMAWRLLEFHISM